MSLASLERALVKSLCEQLKNPKLTIKHLREWSSSEAQVDSGLQEKEQKVFSQEFKLWCAIADTAPKTAK